MDSTMVVGKLYQRIIVHLPAPACPDEQSRVPQVQVGLSVENLFLNSSYGFRPAEAR
jgi:hypothetical protein